MSERSWFSIRTTTSWSKLLVASEWIVRGTAESPGATRGTTLHATTARAATRIEAAITRNAGGRPVGGIKGTSERCPHPNPRYMPTRQRISILVTAMRNTHVRGRDEESMFANVRRVYQSEELDSSFSSSSYSCMESRRGRARDRRCRRLLPRITRAVTSPRTTTNKAKGQEIPRGRVGRENADDSTSKCPWELDVRPALSTALTWTVCGPFDM